LDNPRIPKPEKIRTLEGTTNGWGWIDHRLKWFWDDMTQEELLLYTYLITSSDKDGCCWDSCRQMTRVLKMGPKSLITARGMLEERGLIACKKDDLSQRIIYQLLSLPIETNQPVEIPLKKKLLKKNAAKDNAGSVPQPLSDDQHQRNLLHLSSIQEIINKH